MNKINVKSYSEFLCLKFFFLFLYLTTIYEIMVHTILYKEGVSSKFINLIHDIKFSVRLI